MIDYKSRENRKYLLFFVLILLFAIGFIKIKSFYHSRIIAFQKEADTYRNKLAIAKSLIEKKSAFLRKLNRFPLADSYQIMEELNRLQDKYRISIDSIKPLNVNYSYLADINKHLPHEISWLGFLIITHGDFYRIANFIGAIENMGGFIQNVNFSLRRKKLKVEVKVIFVVRQNKDSTKL